MLDQAEHLREIVRNHKRNQLSVEASAEEAKSHARVITVTSGKGGVGKSSFSINLALILRRQGKRVVIFDADFGLANVEVMFGVVPKYTLADLMYKNMDLKDIIAEGPEGVKFISGGSGIAKLVNLDKDQLRNLVYKLSELDTIADVVIVDTGAGISNSVLEFVSSSPEVVIVATPEPTSITDSYALVKALKSYNGFEPENTKLMLAGNRIITPKDGNALYDKLSTVINRFLGLKLEYLGSVPFDDSVVKAIMKQAPVTKEYPASAASRAYMQIMEKLMHSDAVTSKNEKTGMAKFFQNVLKRTGRF